MTRITSIYINHPTHLASLIPILIVIGPLRTGIRTRPICITGTGMGESLALGKKSSLPRAR